MAQKSDEISEERRLTREDVPVHWQACKITERNEGSFASEFVPAGGASGLAKRETARLDGTGLSRRERERRKSEPSDRSSEASRARGAPALLVRWHPRLLEIPEVVFANALCIRPN